MCQQPGVLTHALCLVVLYISQLMYTIQYWNERDAEWRGTGSGSISDYDAARQRMRALAEQCDYACHFRVDPQPPRGGCVMAF